MFGMAHSANQVCIVTASKQSDHYKELQGVSTIDPSRAYGRRSIPSPRTDPDSRLDAYEKNTGKTRCNP